MKIEERLSAFARLGDKFTKTLSYNEESELSTAIDKAHEQNPWFTPNNVRFALTSIAEGWLKPDVLSSWTARYPEAYFNQQHPVNVGVIMAGNIPLVGFHDFLCVLATGNRITCKLSSRDGNLMKSVANALIQIEPRFSNLITITDDTLKDFDAVIATGSNNSARYFDFYFGKYPSIIRSHRNGIAVLTGKEAQSDFTKLGEDIFTYFGLGCRSVSKLLVPSGYNFTPLLDSLCQWKDLINHHRYANNYEYQRAIFSINQTPHLDTGFLLVTPSEQLDSPVGVLHYQEYNKLDDALKYIEQHDKVVQCVVGLPEVHPKAIPFGSAQKPDIAEYADGIDTIEFLSQLQAI
jgi:hypothetical protein